MIVHEADLLAAGDDAVHAHRAEVLDLCRRHGQDGNRVSWVEADLVDMPLLRFGVPLHDDAGNCYLDGAGYVAEKAVEVPLVGELPGWWQAPCLRQEFVDASAPSGSESS